jgi:chemotaxis protein methyltransferase CheR
LEAAEQVRALRPDLLTLDIHMPEQTGIEYLEKNMRPGHPPVVMVTSVSRENAELAGRALALGAADFVEKPALSNLQERGEELRTKLRCSMMAGTSSPRLELDRAFQKASVLSDPEQKLRIITLPLSARGRLAALFKDLPGLQPPTVVWIEGAREALPALAEALSRETKCAIRYAAVLPPSPRAGETYLLDLAETAAEVRNTWAKGRDVSILVLGEVSRSGADRILAFSGAQLLLEDLGGGRGAPTLIGAASDVVAATSFAYLSNDFFIRKSKVAGVRA